MAPPNLSMPTPSTIREVGSWVPAHLMPQLADTENLVHMLLAPGISIGISFDKINALRTEVAGRLDGANLYGTLWRCGLPKTLQTEAVAV